MAIQLEPPMNTDRHGLKGQKTSESLQQRSPVGGTQRNRSRFVSHYSYRCLSVFIRGSIESLRLKPERTDEDMRKRNKPSALESFARGNIIRAATSARNGAEFIRLAFDLLN